MDAKPESVEPMEEHQALQNVVEKTTVSKEFLPLEAPKSSEHSVVGGDNDTLDAVSVQSTDTFRALGEIREFGSKIEGILTEKLGNDVVGLLEQKDLKEKTFGEQLSNESKSSTKYQGTYQKSSYGSIETDSKSKKSKTSRKTQSSKKSQSSRKPQSPKQSKSSKETDSFHDETSLKSRMRLSYKIPSDHKFARFDYKAVSQSRMSIRKSISRNSIFKAKADGLISTGIRQTMLRKLNLHESTSSERLTSERLLDGTLYSQDMEIDTIMQKMKFLNTFKNLPDIQEISSTVSLELEKSIKETKAKTNEIKGSTDPGMFVAKAIDSREFIFEDRYEVSADDRENDESVNTVEVECEESVKDDESYVSLDSALLIEGDKLFEEQIKKQELDYFKLISVSIADENQDDFEDSVSIMMAEKQRLDLEMHASKFLDEMIERVVGHCEAHDLVLQKLLDKNKLMEELLEVVDKYTEERLICDFLNKRTVEYYIRKRMYWPINPLTDIEVHRRRYNVALQELDCIMEKDRLIQESKLEETNNLIAEEASLRKKTDDQIKELENFITETICQRDGFDKIKHVTADMLKKMAKTRDELYDVRLALILKQHTYANIMEKLEALEDIGEGLKMREFQAKQSEVQNMSKKIEERNSELKRLYSKVNSDIHMMAHLKSKEKMLNKELKEHSMTLGKLRGKQRELREQIHRANLEHGRTRREIDDIKEKGSLLHYPLLMKDFDITHENIQEKRAIVNNLRVQHDSLVEKIYKMEQSRSSLTSL